MESESSIQRKVMKVIRDHNGYVYKNAQNMYTEKGRPDLTACIPVSAKHLYDLYGDREIGLFLAIEMKRPDKITNTSLAQEVVGKEIKKAGGLWMVNADPVLVDALLYKLRGGKDAL